MTTMLPGPTLEGLLADRAERTPDASAYLFLRDGGDVVDQTLTWAALERRSRALARRLAAMTAPGDRALLICPQGLDFLVGFFACLGAGVIAVPTPMPTGSARTADGRIASIIDDCAPAAILTTAAAAARVRAACEGAQQVVPATIIEIDGATSDEAASSSVRRRITPETIAFLQYTSGSTASPRGVRITHGNLVANLTAAFHMASPEPAAASVSWLPVTHDMGLIEGVLQPAFRGHLAVLMSPAAFLQRPVRWLRAIARYGAARSGGPNFAYDLCVRRVTAEDTAGLDLRSWRDAYNGAEPVRADTMRAFASRFAGAGFNPRAFRPCYGLAEATLLVASSRWTPAGGDAAQNMAPVSCGQAAPGVDVLIVDPQTRCGCDAGTAGEIWVRGASVSPGYWRQHDGREVFGARTADGRGPFLRTGDFGLVSNGNLTVTGRLKDVLIVRGYKLFPQDLEHTAAAAHPAVRPAAVSAVATRADASGDCIGLAAEIDPRRATTSADTDAIIAAIRVAVQHEHGVQLDAVALVRPGGVPRTTSGKVQRYLCRRGWRSGGLPMLAEWRRPVAVGG